MNLLYQKKYVICAGEPSGDLLAADVAKAFKELAPDLVSYGVTGRHMEEAGVIPLARIDELSVMGFTEVIKKLPSIIQLKNRLIANIVRLNPEFVILVDYPGLHRKIAEELKEKGFRVFQLVAPQLWAWKEKRVYAWKRCIDLMLGLMPFEEEFFAKYDLPFAYVGTPQVDRVARTQAFMPSWPIAHQEQKLAGFFPGSRVSEFHRLGPKYLETIEFMRHNPKFKNVDFYVSIGPEIPVALARDLACKTFNSTKEEFTKLSIPEFEIYRIHNVYFLKGHSLELMNRIDAAIVTSGTATLECALMGTPMAVSYITSSLNYAIAKRVVTLPHIALVNIVFGREMVREFIQDFSTEELAIEIGSLLFDDEKRTIFKKNVAELQRKVTGHMGKRTAETILNFTSSSQA